MGSSAGDALGQPGRLFHAAHLAQELVDVGQAHAADHALEADAAVVLLLEEAQQVDLVFVARRVVGVAALGGVGRVGAAVPDQQALAQAGSGGDQGAVADLAGVALAEGVDLVGGELGHAVAVGLKIVDEEDVVDAEAGRELAAVQGPGQVGQAQAAVAHRAGHAEAGRGHLVRAQKLLDDLFQAGVILGRIDACRGCIPVCR